METSPQTDRNAAHLSFHYADDNTGNDDFNMLDAANSLSRKVRSSVEEVAVLSNKEVLGGTARRIFSSPQIHFQPAQAAVALQKFVKKCLAKKGSE